MIRRLSKFHASLALVAVAVALDVSAQNAIPAQFQGKWVPAKAACESGLGVAFSADRVTLFNGKDTEAIGGVEMAGPGFFPPGYRGIQVVAITEFSGHQPVTAFFNADEKKGAAYVEYSPVMAGNQTAQSKAYNARISKLNLAKRFPLSKVPLKKCAK